MERAIGGIDILHSTPCLFLPYFSLTRTKYMQKDVGAVCTCLRFNGNGENDLKRNCNQFNDLQKCGT